jgi:chromosome segregation ATPase
MEEARECIDRYEHKIKLLDDSLTGLREDCDKILEEKNRELRFLEEKRSELNRVIMDKNEKIKALEDGNAKLADRIRKPILAKIDNSLSQSIIANQAAKISNLKAVVAQLHKRVTNQRNSMNRFLGGKFNSNDEIIQELKDHISRQDCDIQQYKSYFDRVTNGTPYSSFISELAELSTYGKTNKAAKAKDPGDQVSLSSTTPPSGS